MSSGTEEMLAVFFEVVQSLAPLVIFFALFQRTHLKLPFSQLIKFYFGLILAGLGRYYFFMEFTVAFSL